MGKSREWRKTRLVEGRVYVLGAAGNVARRGRLHIVGQPSLRSISNESINQAH
jgi:hypothetical protein